MCVCMNPMVCVCVRVCMCHVCVCVCVKPKHVNTRLQSHTIQTCVPFIYLEFQAHGVVGRADLTLGKDESAQDERDVVYI